MNALTVNGKQLFAACESQVELVYFPESLANNLAIFPGDGNTIYAGEYEFRVNVPDAAYVYGRNVPGMDPTPIPIVNGVAKWTNPEDFTVWNTSIYFLCLLPEDYTTVYPDPDALDVTLTPSNFMLIKTDAPLEILGYDERIIDLRPMSDWSIAPKSVSTLTVTNDNTVICNGVGDWNELIYRTITVNDTGSYTLSLKWTAPNGLDFWSSTVNMRQFGLWFDTSLSIDYTGGYEGARSQGILMQNADSVSSIHKEQTATINLTAGVTYYVWLSYGTLEDYKEQPITYEEITLTKV